MVEAAQHSLADALGFQPGVTLRTFGMRRSGNHAVINWLQRNAPTGGAVFLNNCAVGRPAQRTWRAVELNGKRANISKGDDLKPAISAAGDGALVIISYEDFSPQLEEIAELTKDLPVSNVTHEVLVYRNFMNWVASLLRKLQVNYDYDTLVCLRIMMMALDKYRDMLELVAEAKSIGMVPVNFDRWSTRPVYRQKLLEELGLPCKDNTLGMVQSYGGGSSFQKDAIRAEDLNTDQRWREMANDGAFQVLLLAASQDKELVTLMQKLMPKDAELMANYLDQAQFPYIVQVGDT